MSNQRLSTIESLVSAREARTREYAKSALHAVQAKRVPDGMLLSDHPFDRAMAEIWAEHAIAAGILR